MAYQAIRSNSSVKLFFLALFVAVIVAMGFIYRYYFWPFIFAFIFYVPLKPVHARLLKYLKRKRLVSLLLIVRFWWLSLCPLFF